MIVSGFDILGAELPKRVAVSWSRTLIALAAGVVGAVTVKKHPVIAFLGAAAVASNAHAVVKGDRTVKAAIKRMGRHVVATVGSLSVPKYPAMGYVAGAVAADLLIDDEGGGIIEEFADYEGIKSSLRGDVIEAEFTETKSPGVALQKVER
jgi:hypothetical protein